MGKTTGAVEWPKNLAYPRGKVFIKKCKMGDIKKLQTYIPNEYDEYYKEICQWPIIKWTHWR